MHASLEMLTIELLFDVSSQMNNTIYVSAWQIQIHENKHPLMQLHQSPSVPKLMFSAFQDHVLAVLWS